MFHLTPAVHNATSQEDTELQNTNSRHSSSGPTDVFMAHPQSQSLQYGNTQRSWLATSMILLCLSTGTIRVVVALTTPHRRLMWNVPTRTTSFCRSLHRIRPCSTIASLPHNNDTVDEVFKGPIATPAKGRLPASTRFTVTSKYTPTGDQPAAIEQLTKQMKEDGDKYSILRGITGTGKTFVMAHIIANLNKPCLVLCHNKTLAAQLARELRSFLSKNAVELFVSYYNHFVPESYKESTGKYIAKKTSVNEEIDALRHRATRALLTRSDVVVVASVSCLYGLGLPKEYLDNSIPLEVSMDEPIVWVDFAHKLDTMLYTISIDDEKFSRGQYQLVQNELGTRKTVTVWPPHDACPMTLQLDLHHTDDTYRLTSIQLGSPSGPTSIDSIHLFPAKHHVVSEDNLDLACRRIEDELRSRVRELETENKKNEANRLQQRVLQDLSMIREVGYCKGVENYSRHFAGRAEGEAPDTLIDYFGLLTTDEDKPRDWLLIVDESHVTVPQLSTMYAGDRSRKDSLVKHGYRLPSALDNRPLQASEFWSRVHQTLFVSATPHQREVELAERKPVDMMIRPTFVCDPTIEVRPVDGQLGDLLREIKSRALLDQRSLAIALTKRDAEDLSSYLKENGVASTFIHCDLTTNERSDALRKLQVGEVDCLVGVNLLREGLDLPQVTLVAILGADAQGFLRSETALFQTIGRAARNVNGKAILYAKRVTAGMKSCIDETARRRTLQLAYNEEHSQTSISTTGSSALSIFDLAREEIEAERPLEIVGKTHMRGGDSAAGLLMTKVARPSPVNTTLTSHSSLTTDHIPTTPGIYFWRDENDEILYIGKAANLRSRVRSYHAKGSRHSPRIALMVKKAASIDFVLTPTERDALVLESNLIKHHQPRFNVLLKDDEHYPYICASCGDAIPRLFVSTSKQEGHPGSQNHRFFGPYTSFKEINAILDGVEEKYDLRSKSFLVRHGSESKLDYQRLFEQVMNEVFSGNPSNAGETTSDMREMRLEYEQAGLLFDSEFNRCRDVVAVGKGGHKGSTIVVLVLQLRDGIVAGRFSYMCELKNGVASDEDFADLIQTVLVNRHYPSGGESLTGFSWYPDEIVLSHEPSDIKGFRQSIRQLGIEAVPKKKSIRICPVHKSEARRQIDQRAIEFAVKNANQSALEKSIGGKNMGLVDGTAAIELAHLIGCDKPPARIECYDVSHLQGEHTVASRVVFMNGLSAPHLYRKFNIKTVDGIDDYASLEEVLHRRFLRLPDTSHTNDSWELPDLVVIDGGKGQLTSAIKGMANAGVFPSNVSNNPGDSMAPLKNHGSVAICALAKNMEEVFVPGKSHPVNETPDTPGLLLLRLVRDESHRFALSAHRKRRSIQKSA